MTYSKDWCKGFCSTCGTGCNQYCEQIHEFQAQVNKLRAALSEYDFCRHTGIACAAGCGKIAREALGEE